MTTTHLSTPTVGWEPALSGGDRERALEWSYALANDLRWIDSRTLDASLAYGVAGLAVLFATLADATGGYAEPAQRFVAAAGDRASHELGRRDLGFFSGLTGVLWAESFVARRSRADLVGGDDVDELLFEWVSSKWSGRSGLCDGLVGVGVYALDRVETKPALLERVSEVLRTQQCADLGMAHGLAGVVAFTALASGSAPSGTLLPDITGALLAHQDRSGLHGVFPTHVGAKAHAVPARWCHGDLGAAAALTLAAPLVSHPQVAQAITAALHAVPVTPGPDVDTLGLCHGLAGGALVLQRIALTTQRDRACTAAGEWARALLDRLDSGSLPDHVGLLHGRAGVALALLALATDVAPTWDRALLLS